MTRLPRLVFVLLATLLGDTRLLAQDVTVSPIVWADAADAPDELPTLKGSIRPEFPPELKETTDIGWGCMELLVSDKGAVLSNLITATQPRYQRAMEVGWDGSRRFKPARRNQQPVNSRVRIYFIFNPKSAASGEKNSSPRLLAPCLIVDPKLPQKLGDPDWVTAVFNVSAEGVVASVKDAPKEERAVIEQTISSWHFAPARREGIAIAAELSLPIIVVSPEMNLGQGRVPPSVVTRRDPIYPKELVESKIRGEVVVEFEVDIEGRVRNPTVVKMLNPAFNEAALAAIRRWRFAPARVKGIPVNARVRQPIAFSLDDEPDGGSDGLTVTRAGRPDKMPEELKYDVAPKLKSLVSPIYPYALFSQKISGDAQVSLLVGPAGKVLLTKVVSASRPEFGYALQAAVEHFEYEPALRHARPTNALIGFHQEFKPRESGATSSDEIDALALERKHPERVMTAKELDFKPKPIHAEVPFYPTSLAASGQAGTATIEFLVGEDGGVLLPRLISATLPEFGYAAIQAVSFWQFNPPMSKGKPVITRVQIPITFKPTVSGNDRPAAPSQP